LFNVPPAGFLAWLAWLDGLAGVVAGRRFLHLNRQRLTVHMDWR